jgi:hypothetical protein
VSDQRSSTRAARLTQQMDEHFSPKAAAPPPTKKSKSPSGIPDNWRQPPRLKNLLERAKEDPLPDRNGRDAFKIIGAGSIMVVAGFAVLASMLLWEGAPVATQNEVIAILPSVARDVLAASVGIETGIVGYLLYPRFKRKWA